MTTEKNRDEITIQKKADTKDAAVEQAIELSKQAPLYYACVVLSNGVYYIENRTPFVRVWEEIIGQWENGRLLK